jgi:hypothetical protein
MKDKKQENKEIAIVTPPETTYPLIPPSEVLSTLGLDTGDILIPRVLLMQSTSEAVGDGLAQFGDVVNSVTKEKLGDFNNAIDVIPLKPTKYWCISDMSGTTPKFMRIEPFTAQNANLPWEDMENGKPIRRDMSLDFYCLLSKEVELGDAFPVVLSFRRTSYPAGKTLASHLMKLGILGKPAFSKTVTLKLLRQKKDTNTFAVWSVLPGRACTTDELSLAKTWATALSTVAVKVDQGGEDPDLQTAGKYQATGGKVISDDVIIGGATGVDVDAVY